MKVVSAKQMGLIESNAYRDGSLESEFMEEAGSGVALVAYDYLEKYDIDRHVTLLCGKGNNAGDAYVAGINLIYMDCDVVAIQVSPISECSELCRQNHDQFINEGGRVVQFDEMENLSFPTRGLLIDGLFGTGFHGVPKKPYSQLIEAANRSKLPIISVDIPSGLDGNTGDVKGEAIFATETAFLGLPKTGFFLKNGWNHVGKLRYVDFGIPKNYIDESDAMFHLLTDEMTKPLLPKILNDRHKYQAGHVVAIAGSPGMPGAALLSCSAAFGGGAGIVHLLHPKGMEIELAASPYELIRIPYTYDNLEKIIEFCDRASAVLIGPGLGRDRQVRDLLHTIMPKIKKPCVIDADALSIMAEEDLSLPDETILTPHHGEMSRLLKIPTPDQITEEFLRLCQDYTDARNVTLVLKGGTTFIFRRNHPIHVNGIGDPGMATAGSGDVLTGLLAALLSQGMKPINAAYLGVYLHGLAGEHAAEVNTSYCMTASDIVNYFPEAFRFNFP